jgi:hypothetical protein
VTTARQRSWSALGSTLWLRTVAGEDRGRVTAFGARGDVVWSEPEELVLRARRNGRPKSRPLVAVDPWGTPAVLLTLHYGPAAGEATLSFGVPQKGAHALREALRLLEDLVRRRTRLGRVRVRVRPHGIGVRRVLTECGWREGTPGAWFLEVRRARNTAPEAAHAG